MPGHRLTYEDRQAIEDGLASRLTYAEIARQLGRPTSTVTREVSRNGGYGGYRSRHADFATTDRARRGPAGTTGRQPRRVSPAQRFDDRFASHMAQTGLPPMPARVLVCLITSDRTDLTATELAVRLRVSPASISKAVGYLENLSLLVRHRDPGSRRDRYSLGDDIWYRAYRREIELCKTWATMAQQGATAYGPVTTAGARLAEMNRFFTEAAAHMTAIAEAWRSSR